MKTVIPDINVLIACARPDHSCHRAASDWLNRAAQDAQLALCTIALPMLVVAGFVRLVTHPKIMQPPNTSSEALAYIDELTMALDLSSSEASTWTAFKALVLKQALAGNDVPDAWLASHAISTGATVVTFDKGFKKLLPKQHVLVLSPV